MLLTLDIKDIHSEKILFGNKITNNRNIIDNGFFYQIYYVDSKMTLTSIIISIKLKNIHIYKMFHKHKIEFDYEENKEILQQVILLEKIILDIFYERVIKDRYENINSKETIYKLSDILINQQVIKGVFNNGIKVANNSGVVQLKISGIWENDSEYGINYKFI